MKNIILLHGALGDESQMFDLQKELSSRFNCFTFSFPGHGKKAKQNNAFSISAFAEDLKRFILKNHLSGCDIFGYSMGGFVATYLCYTNPSLISKVTTYGTQFNWSPEISAKETQRLNPEIITAKVPAFAKALEKTHGSNWKNILKNTADLMTNLGANNPLNETVLQSIQNEITILRGSEDNMITSDFSRQVSLLLPNSEFHKIKGLPHPLQKVDLNLLAQFIT